MKVYIVTETCDCEDTGCFGVFIDKVFLNEKKAKDYIKDQDWMTLREYEVPHD